MERHIRRHFGRDPLLRDGTVDGKPVGEIVDEVDAAFRERRQYFDNGVIADSRWNRWRLDPAGPSLLLVDDTEWTTTRIDLLVCAEPAQVLNLIVHISGKDWPHHDIDKITLGLLYAFDDVLHLQASMCGFGVHTVMADQQIADRVACFVQQFHEGQAP